MQKVFEQNFRNFNEAEEESKGVSGDTGRYKIDLLDGVNDEEEYGDEEMDDDEKKIKQSIKRSNFESVFGIEGDE